jgi:hypothetical protein
MEGVIQAVYICPLTFIIPLPPFKLHASEKLIARRQQDMEDAIQAVYFCPLKSIIPIPPFKLQVAEKLIATRQRHGRCNTRWSISFL